MLRRKHNRFVCRLLAVAVAATSIFATSPVTQAKTVEVATEASQVAAEEQIILHVKGTGLTIHYWKGSTGTTWPGEAMEADPVMGNGWSYCAFDAGVDGFLIVQGGNKLTPDDVTGKAAGEYWFVDGKFYDSDPEGPATPTPEPTPGPLNIKNVSPADGTALKAGETQTITVGASSTINDGVVYYKYEVKCGGEYVGDHYYSKNNTYSFTPEDGKEYTVKISVQAHDEANTTVTKELKYKGSDEGIIATTSPEQSDAPETEVPQTTAPVVSDEPENTSNPVETDTPATPDQPGNTNNPAETDTPATPDQPINSNQPVNSKQPDKTDKPSETIKPSDAPAPTNPVKTTKPSDAPAPTSGTNINQTPAPDKPNQTPAPTQTPGNSGFDPYFDLTVKGSSSKKSPQKAGTSIKLTATASNGTGTYKYMFFYKTKVNSNNETVIRKYGTSNSCTWKPTKAGTYYVYVRVIDALNRDSEAQIGKYVIKGLSATVKLSKKSPQKRNKKITITATPKNASGKVKYRFVVKLKKKTVKDSKYKTTSKYNWKPTKKGTYTLYVYVKDSYKTVTKKTTFKIK